MSERLDVSSIERDVEDTPERTLLEGVRSAALDILHSNPENLLAREIAEKMLMKAEIKDRIDEMSAHADDVAVYQELKKLGIFVVRDAKATFDYGDPESGFSLQTGDSYLDLHVPPVPEGLRSRAAVRASLDLVRQYAEEHQLEPKYVMGVTYERMARVANRVFGFDIAYPSADSLPDEVVGGVERVFQQFTEAGHSGQEMGMPAIVFMKLDGGELQPLEAATSIGSVALTGYQE